MANSATAMNKTSSVGQIAPQTKPLHQASLAFFFFLLLTNVATVAAFLQNTDSSSFPMNEAAPSSSAHQTVAPHQQKLPLYIVKRIDNLLDIDNQWENLMQQRSRDTKPKSLPVKKLPIATKEEAVPIKDAVAGQSKKRLSLYPTIDMDKEDNSNEEQHQKDQEQQNQEQQNHQNPQQKPQSSSRQRQRQPSSWQQHRRPWLNHHQLSGRPIARGSGQNLAGAKGQNMARDNGGGFSGSNGIGTGNANGGNRRRTSRLRGARAREQESIQTCLFRTGCEKIRAAAVGRQQQTHRLADFVQNLDVQARISNGFVLRRHRQSKKTMATAEG